MIEIHGNYESIEFELNRIEHQPDGHTLALLESALEKAFGITQMDVHVITGHLKASGDKDSHVVGETWHGSISYGEPGDAHWKKDPHATYATFERGRGGSHDFFGNIHILDDTLLHAVEEGLAGDN